LTCGIWLQVDLSLCNYISVVCTVAFLRPFTHA
jgi:hypothetical protein